MKKNFSFGVHLPVVPYVARDLDVLSTESVLDGGRIVPHSVYVTDVLADRYKGLKSYQYALDNQLALGVDLKQIKPLSGSAFDIADSAVRGMQYLISTSQKQNSVISSDDGNGN